MQAILQPVYGPSAKARVRALGEGRHHPLHVEQWKLPAQRGGTYCRVESFDHPRADTVLHAKVHETPHDERAWEAAPDLEHEAVHAMQVHGGVIGVRRVQRKGPVLDRIIGQVSPPPGDVPIAPGGNHYRRIATASHVLPESRHVVAHHAHQCAAQPGRQWIGKFPVGRAGDAKVRERADHKAALPLHARLAGVIFGRA